MFDKDKLESAFNVAVKYGFCSDCRWEFDSEKCHQFDCYENSVKIIREAIDFALNNEPVKHGHWYNRGGRFRCTVCDTKAYLKDVGGTGGWSHEYIQQKSPYCPNCGAKMDGGK